MNNQDKTKDELIKELQKLQQEYDLLKTSYEKNITERKLAEEELPEPGIPDKELMDLSRDVIFSLTSQGLFGSMNQAFEKITGWQTQEWIGKPFTDLLHPEDIPLAAERFSNLLKGHTAQAVELRIRKKSGDYGCTEVLASPRMKKGMITGILGIGRDITERKKVEEELKRSEMQYRSLAENSPDLIARFDRQCRHLYVNPVAAKAGLYSPCEYIGKTIAEVGIPEEEAGRWAKRIRTVFETGQVVDVEDTFETPDGIRYFNTKFVPEFDPDGSVQSVQSIARDITERKGAEEALQESEERFRQLYQQAPLGYQSLDAEGCFIDINQAWLDLMGYSRDQVIGRWFGDFLAPQEVDIFKQRFPCFKATGEVHVDLEMVQCTGSRIIVHIDGKTGHDEHGQFKQTHCILHNITERKRVEEMLQKRELKYRNLIEQAPDIIFVVDAEGNLIYVNQTGQKMLGYSEDELYKMKTVDTYPTDEMTVGRRRLKEFRAMRAGDAMHFERLMRRKDGSSFPVEINVGALEDGTAHAIIRDITERKRLEEILKKEQQELKLIIDSSPIIIFYKDKEGKFIRVNKILAEAIKLPEDEFVGKTVFDLYSDKIAQSMTNDDQEVLKSGRPKLNIIEQYESASGIRWVQTDKNPICDKNGISSGLIGFAQDITERKQAEEALVIANDRLAHDLESMTRLHILGTLLVRKDGMHAALQEMLDVAIAIANADMGNIQLLDRQSGSLKIQAHRGFEQPFLDFWDSVLEGQGTCGTALEGGKRMIVEDVSQNPIFAGSPALDVQLAAGVRAVQSTPLIGRSGNVIGMCSTHFRIPHRPDEQTLHLLDLHARQVSDIIERVEAEEKLLLEKENFRHSLEDSPLGVRIATIEGNTIYANKTLLNYYGYKNLKELQKTALKKRYTQESYAQAQKRKHKRERGKLSNSKYEVSIVRKNGEIRHLQVFRKEVLWSGIMQFQIIYDDITERKHIEQEIRKSKKLMEDLHKHLDETRENERAVISREIHDQIGQSLTALKLDLNWMTGNLKNTSPESAAKLQGMIELISKTIKDVQRISSDLRPGILDDLGLTAAIEWYCNEFEKRTGIRCSLKLDDSTFDDSQKNLVFFRVLQEALTNVIRHADASSVSLILHQSKQRITLTIHDNGIGIPEEKIESYKSLGLISMRERVRQFDGKFVVSAKEGNGTKLTVSIPK